MRVGRSSAAAAGTTSDSARTAPPATSCVKRGRFTVKPAEGLTLPEGRAMRAKAR